MKRLVILLLLLAVLMNCAKSEELTMEATAYCLKGRTCSEAYPFPGVIASDHSILPLGSIVFVEGYGYAVVLDSGGAIKGKIIDVWFPDYKTCIEWGRKKVKVKILRKGN